MVAVTELYFVTNTIQHFTLFHSSSFPVAVQKVLGSKLPEQLRPTRMLQIILHAKIPDWPLYFTPKLKRNNREKDRIPKKFQNEHLNTFTGDERCQLQLKSIHCNAWISLKSLCIPAVYIVQYGGQIAVCTVQHGGQMESFLECNLVVGLRVKHGSLHCRFILWVLCIVHFWNLPTGCQVAGSSCKHFTMFTS